MGWLSSSNLGAAGKHLMEVLAAEGGKVRYSRFYDGKDEKHEELMKALGLDSDWVSPELLMDESIGLLEKAGFVTTTFLSEKLADGEPNYEIALTVAGWELARSGKTLQFPDIEV